MAKKKPIAPPSDEPPKRPARSTPGRKPETKPPGQSAEGGAPNVSGPKPSKQTRSVSPVEALEAARGLALESAKSFEPRKKLALAKQAVAMSPDCAEGFLLLAEMASSRKQALGFYHQAVEASERVLGPELFREGEGSFWGLMETRFYMKARLGLAEALWASGRRAEAADHLEAMLVLNPNDNQGLRYILAGWLLHLDALDALDRLLERFDEDSTAWSFTKTLVAFRRDGDSPRTRKLLVAAKKSNKHAIGYLIGQKPLPLEQPPYYAPGSEEDAVLYVGSHLAAWRSVPGAITWVRSRVKERRRRPKALASTGPTPASEDRLRDLPSEMDAWQADFRQFTRRIEIAGERVRPWMVLVSSRTNDLVLAHALVESAPSPDDLWDIVVGAMEKPAAGLPHRPSEIQVRPGEHWDTLSTHFEAIGIACSPTERLDQVDYLFDDLSKHMAGIDPPGILDMPGVTPEQVGRFYQAAVEFYRRAPWRSLGYEAVIRIECDRYQSGPWFAVIMGQSGLTLGLALYEDLNLLRRMWAGKFSDEEGARKTVALTVTFDDDSTIPEADLEAIETHGWPIASPEAYPSLFRKERGLSMRPPLSWEIDLMDACLRVLPDFVARRSPDDLTRELVPVPGAAMPMELGLCWLEESY